MRTLGILILLVIWMLIGFYMCDCQKQNCNTAVATEQAPAPVAPAPVAKTVPCEGSPICFAADSCEPILGSSFERMRDSLVALQGQGNLQITGAYSSTESYNGDFDNLGLCRAHAIKSLFANYIDTSDVDIQGQQIVGAQKDTNGLWSDMISFNFLQAETAPELAAQTLIYFPFNSVNKLNDAEIEAYLDKLAVRLQKTQEKVRLVGHTDNIGSPQSNQLLGLWRAEVIRDYLVGKGVSTNRIVVSSKGEAQPIATNATNEGRAKNRRTELSIIK